MRTDGRTGGAPARSPAGSTAHPVSQEGRRCPGESTTGLCLKLQESSVPSVAGHLLPGECWLCWALGGAGRCPCRVCVAEAAAPPPAGASSLGLLGPGGRAGLTPGGLGGDLLRGLFHAMLTGVPGGGVSS